MSDADISDFENGDIVQLIAEFNGNAAEHQLVLSAGQRLQVLAVEGSGWIWGKTLGVSPELTGYFPYNHAIVLEKFSAGAGVALPPPPDLSAVPQAPTKAAAVAAADIYIPFDNKNYAKYEFGLYAGTYFRKIDLQQGTSASRDVDVHELVFYSKDWNLFLTKKMARMPELVSLCREMLEYVNSYANNASAEEKPWISRIVGIGIREPELRDELFIHLCKQLNHNPSEESRARYWELLHVSLDYFTPNTFIPTMINFLRAQHVKGMHSADDKMAKTAEMKFAVTFRKGSRQEPLSSQEATALIKKLPFTVPLLYVDGKWEWDEGSRKFNPKLHYKFMKTTPNTTIQDFKIEMGRAWRRLDQGGTLTMAFGIYEVGTFFGIEEEVELDGKTCVRDAIARWQSKRRSPDARLVYKIKLYTPELLAKAQGNKELFDLVYIHLVHNVLTEKIFLNYRDTVRLVALKLQQEEQLSNQSRTDDYEPKIRQKLRVQAVDYMPRRRVIEGTKWMDKYGYADIFAELAKLQSVNAEECKKRYLTIIKDLPTYGTELFEVQYADGVDTGAIRFNEWLMLGVCAEGIKLLQPQSLVHGFLCGEEEDKDGDPVKVLKLLKFSVDYTKWGCSNKFLFLWLTGTTEPVYRFRTVNGVQICFLLGAYDNFANFRSQTFKV